MYVFPGARETLATWKAKGIRLALLTNGEAVSQRAKIDRFGLSDYFDAILIEGERGFGKPDPRVYHQALAELGVTAPDVVMVGDNWVWDVDGAAAVGIDPIWVNRTQKPRPDGGALPIVRIVRALSEVPALLCREEAGKENGTR